ncbi:MAG TPA: class I SAM-dependent methyltransferase [Humisphaera sp.]|nr:class I SAM-dependent methyltransferase [Humisphaera sp.]
MMVPSSECRPTQRFSDRVTYYVRARPGYPAQLIEFFVADLGVAPVHRIVDVGSGTGLLSELFLRNGNQVIGLEPNTEMREAGEEFLRKYPNFQSVNATAEATTLPDRAADFVVAGQSFHWFDRVKARSEFGRISSPGCRIVLVWNERLMSASRFDAGYDRLIREFAVESHVDRHVTLTHSPDAALGPFFGPDHFKIRRFDNFQELNLDDLKARLLSSSYMPLPGYPMFLPMIARAEDLFAAHAVGGRVRISYDTRAYYGTIS